MPGVPQTKRINVCVSHFVWAPTRTSDLGPTLCEFESELCTTRTVVGSGCSVRQRPTGRWHAILLEGLLDGLIPLLASCENSSVNRSQCQY